MHLGTQLAQLGAPPRRLTVDVEDVAAIGWRCPGRLLILHCSQRSCEVRNYGHGGKLQVLLTLAGGRRRIECEEVDGRLTFRVDGECVFSIARDRNDWALYSSGA